jgi:hypothetical protein
MASFRAPLGGLKVELVDDRGKSSGRIIRLLPQGADNFVGRPNLRETPSNLDDSAVRGRISSSMTD